jgi:hypothetical protein
MSYVRCKRKLTYSHALAVRVAERCSKQTGEWIIAYRCLDCGRWHIGHADRSQLAVLASLELQARRRQINKKPSMKCRLCGPTCTHTDAECLRAKGAFA